MVCTIGLEKVCGQSQSHNSSQTTVSLRREYEASPTPLRFRGLLGIWAVLLAVSSTLTIADTRKGFAVTGTVSGACIIVRHPPHPSKKRKKKKKATPQHTPTVCFFLPRSPAGRRSHHTFSRAVSDPHL